MSTTGYIHLFPGGFGPDASGTGNNSASLDYRVSSGSQTANTPKVTRILLVFDGATDEHWEFPFKMPGDYASGGTLRGSLAPSDTNTGNVYMKAAMCKTSGDNSDDVFSSIDNSSAIAMPGVAHQEVEFSFALTNAMSGIAANDSVVLMIGRDADAGGDTYNSHDAELYNLTFEYTTT